MSPTLSQHMAHRRDSPTAHHAVETEQEEKGGGRSNFSGAPQPISDIVRSNMTGSSLQGSVSY